MRIKWEKEQNGYGAGYRANMPNEVTLCVTPDNTTRFGSKPKRGTTWRASASQWDEATRTMSRFGRDEYSVRHASYKDAMRAAEAIYTSATE